MGTYLLTWNPSRFPFTDYDRLQRRVNERRIAQTNWSTGNNKSILANERIFLLRQHRDRGIVASGITTSRVRVGPHWEDRKRTAKYIRIQFDTMLPVDRCLPVTSISQAKLGVNWDRIQASGIGLAPKGAMKLERIWQRHLLKMNVEPSELLAEEVSGQDSLREGAVSRIVVNAYERNPAARRACIEHYGSACAVCHFDFEEFYGDLGRGYIHVHHLRELASIGEEYQVDPIADLRPVCPNCHAMLHRRQPALSIESLRRKISRKGANHSRQS